MASKKYVVPLVILTACAIAAYAAYRLIPRRRTSNGTPASGGAIGGGGTDPYYDQNYPQSGTDLASLFSALASLFKKGSGGGSPIGSGGPGGGGLLKGSNLNAYNVLYDAQHNLNQDGTPIDYGSAATTNILAESINAQIPLEGLSTVDLPSTYVNPISDAGSSNAALAASINPLIPEESTSSPAGDAFTQWWDSFTGNPLNQPDTLPDQSISSNDLSSYASSPDYLSASGNDYFSVGSGDQTGDYSGYSYQDGYGSGDYYSGDSYDGSSSSQDNSSQDNSSQYSYVDNSGGGDSSGGDSGSGYDPYAGGFDNFG